MPIPLPATGMQSAPAPLKPNYDLTSEETFASEFRRVEEAYASTKTIIEDNRKIRKPRVNIETMKQEDKLQPHETYIAARVIDEGIRQDVPNFIQYLKGSDRLAVFTPVGKLPIDPQTGRPADINTDELERAFARALKYGSWETDYIMWTDSGQLHGVGWMEVMFDIKRDYKVSTEFVRADQLIYDPEVTTIQRSKIVARAYNFTMVMFEEYVKNGTFKEDVVRTIMTSVETAGGGAAYNLGNANSTVHKVFFKQEGVVYVAWWSDGQKKYLRDPRPLYNGVNIKVPGPVVPPLPGQPPAAPTITWAKRSEKLYPFFAYASSIDENATLNQQEGHGQRSFYLQEAMTALLTSQTNQAILASRVIWSPKATPDYANGKAPAQLKYKIVNNAIWDSPMDATTPPAPDSAQLETIRYLEQRAAQGNSQVAWGVNNRKDSRKTAEEVRASQSMGSQISSAQVLFFSISLRALLSYCWEIIQSQAQQGLIDLGVDPVLLDLKYELQSAGDVDVIKRTELIQSMQQDWPVVQNTPIAQVFLSDYLSLRYGERGKKYATGINAVPNPQTQQALQLVSSLSALLKEAVTDEHGQLRPEWAAHAAELKQIAGQVQQTLAAGNGALAAPAGNPPLAGNPAGQAQQSAPAMQ